MMEQEEVASWQIILLLVMEMLQLVREKQRKRTLNLLNWGLLLNFVKENSV